MTIERPTFPRSAEVVGITPQCSSEQVEARKERHAKTWLALEMPLHDCVLMCRIAADLAIKPDADPDEVSFATNHAAEMVQALEDTWRLGSGS